METRVDNWPLVLNAVVDEWRRRPFRWGEADCCQFAADLVSAMTGRDYRARFPRYASEADATEILKTYGDIAGLVTSVLGEPKPPAWAHRGDLVVADFGMGLTVGVCVGAHSCAPGARGLVFRDTLAATAAWSV